MLLAVATGGIYPAGDDRADVTVKSVVKDKTRYIFVIRVYESIIRLEGDGNFGMVQMIDKRVEGCFLRSGHGKGEEHCEQHYLVPFFVQGDWVQQTWLAGDYNNDLYEEFSKSENSVKKSNIASCEYFELYMDEAIF